VEIYVDKVETYGTIETSKQQHERQHIMNSQTILTLMLDGAYLNVGESKFYHSSFKKGFRTMLSSNISFVSAQKKLRNMDKLEFVESDKGLTIRAAI
jgi:hypothetical protein